MFCVFYILGNLLGVITIEALLEGQMQKIETRKNQKAKKKASKKKARRRAKKK